MNIYVEVHLVAHKVMIVIHTIVLDEEYRGNQAIP